MKKYVICLMAVAIGIAASAFTAQKETKVKTLMAGKKMIE